LAVGYQIESTNQNPPAVRSRSSTLLSSRFSFVFTGEKLARGGPRVNQERNPAGACLSDFMIVTFWHPFRMRQGFVEQPGGGLPELTPRLLIFSNPSGLAVEACEMRLKLSARGDRWLRQPNPIVHRASWISVPDSVVDIIFEFGPAHL
jgi:hypothetical protein